MRRKLRKKQYVPTLPQWKLQIWAKRGRISIDHPKPCRKLLQHGTRHPRGCNLGQRCENFHPKMCSSSVSKGECFSQDCPLYHVKGTKRSNQNLDTDKRKRKKDVEPNNNLVSKNQKIPDANDFLEMVRHLKTAMEAMNVKLAPHSQITQSQVQNQITPEMKPQETNQTGFFHPAPQYSYQPQQLPIYYQMPYQHPIFMHQGNHQMMNTTILQPTNISNSTSLKKTQCTADNNLCFFTVFNTLGFKPKTTPSKVPFIQDILVEQNQLFIALTETWLKDHLDAEITIDGYKLFRSDRKRLKTSKRKKQWRCGFIYSK